MQPLTRKETAALVNIGLYAGTSVFLVAFDLRLVGWLLFALTAIVTLWQDRLLKLQMLSLLIPLGIMGLVPGRATSPFYVLFLYYAAGLAPALILRRFWGDHTIKFTFHHGRKWYWYEVLYVFFPMLIGYLALPYYFVSTHQYTNWVVHLGTLDLIGLFIALMAVGLWDELYFIATVLGVFRKWLPFWLANVLQAVVFASFLFALGFGSWGGLTAYVFAWFQGYVFKITGSLLYAITVHLAFDVMLFVVLIHAHYPDQLPIFVTG